MSSGAIFNRVPQTIRSVKKLPSSGRLKDIPLMMATSEIEMSQMAKALEAGANKYVRKPFAKEVIADKLATLGVMA